MWDDETQQIYLTKSLIQLRPRFLVAYKPVKLHAILYCTLFYALLGFMSPLHSTRFSTTFQKRHLKCSLILFPTFYSLLITMSSVTRVYTEVCYLTSCVYFREHVNPTLNGCHEIPLVIPATKGLINVIPYAVNVFFLF